MYNEPIILIYTLVIVSTLSVVYMLAMVWQREKRNQREFELEKMRMELSTKRGIDPFEYQAAAMTVPVVNEINISKDGYIVVEIDQSQRQAFEDILRGFEDYANLKGYKVSVSFDNSILNKFAFKITLHDSQVTVSEEKIKWDMNEYLQKVKNRELDDIPEFLNHSDHEQIKKRLNDRINLVNNDVTEESLKKIQDITRGLTVISNPQITIELGTTSIKQLTGGNDNMTIYQANNSNGIVQGEGNANNSIDFSQNKTDIKIGETYTEKESQLEVIKKLISLIKQDPDSEDNDEAIFNLKTIEKELKNEKVPDASKVGKCLQGVSEALKSVEKGSELFAKLSDVFNSFNLGDLINNIGNNMGG